MMGTGRSSFFTRLLMAGVLLVLAAGAARAGSGEVYRSGSGSIYLGYSVKTGGNRFDEDGNRFRANNGRYHDFRYTYLTFETGLAPGLQAQGTLTYLDGCESFDPGASQDFCHAGGSDQWMGLKYQVLKEVTWPVAVEATVRFPNVYMDDTETTGSGKHWLGIYRRDYALIAHTSHAFGDRAWFAVAGGYIYREGAPADVAVLRPQVSFPLLVTRKGTLGMNVMVDGYFSLSNPSEADPVQDRFGNRREEVPGHFFDFNNSDIVRPSAGFSWNFGAHYDLGIGYSKVAWGRSAHVYDERWLQLGFHF